MLGCSIQMLVSNTQYAILPFLLLQFAVDMLNVLLCLPLGRLLNIIRHGVLSKYACMLDEKMDGFVALYILLLQPLKKRFGVGYLEKARLGQVWQPWYADLLKQGSLTGLPNPCCLPPIGLNALQLHTA